MGGWQQIAALPNKLEKACAVYHAALDKVFLFGGLNQVDQIIAPSPNRTTYIYDPNANTWSTGALMPAGIVANGNWAFVAPDGKIHVLNAAGQHYRYDPGANSWDLQAPNAVMRRTALAFQDSSGRIILASGWTTSAGIEFSYAVERYDPATNAWTSLAAIAGLVEQQINTTGVLGDDGKLYTGYQTSCQNLVVYNPAGPTWSRTPTFPLEPSLGIGGFNVPVSRLPNGMILRLPNRQGPAVRRIDGFDPTTATWTMGVIADFIGPVYDYPAVATDPAGRIWIIGGEDNTGAVPSNDNSKAEGYVFIQNRPPTAATLLTLTGSALVSTAVKNRARHGFNDPDAGDSQSKFEWRHRIVGTTTWTTGTEESPNPWYDIAAGDLDPGNYERQVLTYDAAGLAAPWTASGFFTAADPPAGPTPTYPINGQTVEQLEHVDWSAAAQDSYQVRRVADDGSGDPDTAVVYFDTGEVVDTVNRTLPLTFATNNRDEHVQVRVKLGGLWSDWVDVGVEVSYTPPPVPVVAVYADAATGSLLLMITNPAPTGGEPATAYNDIFIDDGTGFERKATAVATNTGWRYWTPISGRDYLGAIRVDAVAANGTTSSSVV